jgi:hypothetical protein
MSMVRTLFGLTALGIALAGCAYAPESVEPSWTDAEVAQHGPSEAPAFIPEETLDPTVLPLFRANQTRLLEQRDAVQAAAAEIPELEDSSEAFAAAARERADPPDPQ